MLDVDIPKENGWTIANSGDPNQTPRPAASDLDLHCLPVTRLWVSSLQWVNSVYHNCSWPHSEIFLLQVLVFFFKKKKKKKKKNKQTKKQKKKKKKKTTTNQQKKKTKTKKNKKKKKTN